MIGFAAVVTALALTSPAPSFIDRVNAYRASRGVPPVTVDPATLPVAVAWSRTMADRRAIGHNPRLASDTAQIIWTRLGENVGTGPDIDTIETAFEHSPSHAAILADPRYTAMSAGIIRSKDRIYVTLIFRQPASTP